MGKYDEILAQNYWAQVFEEQKKLDEDKRKKAQTKAAKTRSYIASKPQAIYDFERALCERGCKPQSYDDRTANGLTKFILDWLAFYDCYGARINTGGIAIGAVGAGGREKIKYACSQSTKGVADVIACIRGRLVMLEVKAGKDRPRADQLEQQQLVRKAGGYYEFIHNADEFVQVIKAVCNNVY